MDVNSFSSEMNAVAKNSFSLSGLKLVETTQPMIMSGKKTQSSDLIFSRMTVEYKDIPLFQGSEVISLAGPNGSFQKQTFIPTAVDSDITIINEKEALNFAITAFLQDTNTPATSSTGSLEIWVDKQNIGHRSWKVDIKAGTLSAPISNRYWVSAVDKNVILESTSLIYKNDVFYKTNIWGHNGPYEIEEDVGLPFLDVWIKDNQGHQQKTGTAWDGEVYMWGDTSNVNSLKSKLAGPFGNVENLSGTTLEEETFFTQGKDMQIFFGPKSVTDETGFAQSTAYYWAMIGQLFFLNYFDESQFNQLMLRGLKINTNINDDFGCNAYWDGFSLNFFRATDNCNNTATPGIILHELGHGFDNQAGGIQDSAYSEGFGDSMAMLILKDSCLAPSFFKSKDNKKSCLRDASVKTMWPPESNEPHKAGEIYSSFVWQLVQQLKLSTNKEYLAYDVAKLLTFYTAYLNPYDIPNAVELAAFIDYLVADGMEGKYLKEITIAAQSLNLPEIDLWWLKSEDSNALLPPNTAKAQPDQTSSITDTISIGGEIEESNSDKPLNGSTQIIE